MIESMKNFNRELADKYFENHCTPEEAERVLEWLDTEDGQIYLEEMIVSGLDVQAESESEGGSFHLTEDIDSRRWLNSILNRIRVSKPSDSRRFKKSLFYFRAAAAVLVMIAASVLYWTNRTPDYVAEEQSPTHFTTGESGQKESRLADRNAIRLNSNTKLIVSGNFADTAREVWLDGEGYFEVVHHPQNPFTIHTDIAEVEVLGTSFNVRSDVNEGRAEVSVVEGKVALYRNGDEMNRGLILEKNEYAYWDANQKELKREHFGALNYMAWMTNELLFEDLPLSKVCIQLHRFYEVRCEFSSESLRNSALNANIPNPNLQNTLSVIALSLELEYRQEEGRIIWTDSKSPE